MKDGLTSLLRSMPLRLALGLVIMFSIVSLLGLAASYLVTQRSLDQAMRADLTQDMAGFRAAPSANALAALVEAEAQDTDPARMVLSYLTPNQRHFGNAMIARDEDGYHIVSMAQNSPEIEGQYLALTASLKGGQLTIARSRQEIDALRIVFLNILGLSLIPTMLIALSGGLYLARRGARHVAVISASLDELTNGQFEARIGSTKGWSDDLVQIGKKIDKMAQAQETSVAAIRQVSSDIAHDLKTPIQRVALHLDELSECAGLDPEAAELVVSAKDELSGIVSVFHSLLQIAQIESGTPKSRFKQVDLAKLCQTFVEIYEPVATENKKILQNDAQSQTAQIIHGDRDLLGQLLANLIENALRHTPDGSHIVIDLKRSAGTITLSVSDNGSGIPKEDREMALRRLYRLEQSRSTPGNGLGLSLVKVISDLHSAQLELLDNHPGLRVEVSFAGSAQLGDTKPHR